MAPGVHTITICVDNRLKYPMDKWNHGTTEYTQTNWNGMVGDLRLEALPAYAINKIRVDTDIDKKIVNVKLQTIKEPKMPITISINIRDKHGKIVGEVTEQRELKGNSINYKFPIQEKINLWDEFNPYLYKLEVSISSSEDIYEKQISFGFRKVEQGKHHIRLNNRNIHLRGVLDCAVFPMTGYPATDVESWLKIFRTVKEYGMNHVRFPCSTLRKPKEICFS